MQCWQNVVLDDSAYHKETVQNPFPKHKHERLSYKAHCRKVFRKVCFFLRKQQTTKVPELNTTGYLQVGLDLGLEVVLQAEAFNNPHYNLLSFK